MSVDDARSLAYDTEPLKSPLEIIGCPKVTLKVRSTASQANWSVRLEDVSPDGKVALVTGALVNSSQRNDRLAPLHVVPFEAYELQAELHFATWTFKPGHRIRLAVSNAQFPIAWPSAEPMTGSLHVGCVKTTLSLPVVPADSGCRPRLPKVAKRLSSPHGEDIDLEDGKPDTEKYWTDNQSDGSTTAFSRKRSAYRIRQRRFVVESNSSWKTFDTEPWNSQYLGKATTTISSRRRVIKLRTKILVESDKQYFHVTVTRTLSLNGRHVRRRTWQKRIRRQFQ
jgi:hypothetical protein